MTTQMRKKTIKTMTTKARTSSTRSGKIGMVRKMNSYPIQAMSKIKIWKKKRNNLSHLLQRSNYLQHPKHRTQSNQLQKHKHQQLDWDG